MVYAIVALVAICMLLAQVLCQSSLCSILYVCRSGADKVSIGSDAVYVVEEYLKSGKRTGDTSIEQISKVYGAQAVVVSIDPKRVYVSDPSEVSHMCCETSKPGDSAPFHTSTFMQCSPIVFLTDSHSFSIWTESALICSLAGPNGEQYCWWQCTVKGGRETRDLSAVELAKGVEMFGAGEILLNCIDKDGTGEVISCLDRIVVLTLWPWSNGCTCIMCFCPAWLTCMLVMWHCRDLIWSS